MSAIQLHHCRDPRVFLATGCGAGFVRWAPGTAGSLVALPLWWYGLSGLPLVPALVATGALAGVAVWLVAGACRAAGVGDDQRIVLDEWIGMWVTLVGCPRQIGAVFAGFVLFRLFDIFKPWPVSWADGHVVGGLGVVLDDVFAGILAAAVLQLSLVAFAAVFA